MTLHVAGAENCNLLMPQFVSLIAFLPQRVRTAQGCVAANEISNGNRSFRLAGNLRIYR
jgi:hypothetical protein